LISFLDATASQIKTYRKNGSAGDFFVFNVESRKDAQL